MGKDECKVVLDALSKASACCRHLAVTLGGTGDSLSLRRALRERCRKAMELALENRKELAALLKDARVSREERGEYERLWLLLCSTVEMLQLDTRRALSMVRYFPLQLPTRHLLQTGMSGGEALGGGDEQVAGEEAELMSGMELELQSMEELLREMELEVQVAPWAVEASQEAGAELRCSSGAHSLSC